MSPGLLAMLGTLLLIEQAILYLAAAQAITAATVLAVVLVLDRFRRDLRSL